MKRWVPERQFYELETLEPRILLSGDNALADLRAGMAEVPDLIQQFEHSEAHPDQNIALLGDQLPGLYDPSAAVQDLFDGLEEEDFAAPQALETEGDTPPPAEEEAPVAQTGDEGLVLDEAGTANEDSPASEGALASHLTTTNAGASFAFSRDIADTTPSDVSLSPTTLTGSAKLSAQLVETLDAANPPNAECGTWNAECQALRANANSLIDNNVDSQEAEDGDSVSSASSGSSSSIINYQSSIINSQVVYLDFDGADNITYNGPVSVGPFDVPAFTRPELVDDIVAIVQAAFSSAGLQTGVSSSLRSAGLQTGVDFGAGMHAGLETSATIRVTTTRPTSGPYTTVTIGGNDSVFAAYGDFYGLAEQVDVGNLDQSDNALVFSEDILAARKSGDAAQAIADTIIHEVGHLLGMSHEHGDGILDAVAQVADQPDIENHDTYTRGAGDTVVIELAGTGDAGAADGYDQVNVENLATLDGTLEVVLLDGFVPSEGDTFDFLNFGSVSGHFNEATGLYGFGDDLYFDIVQVDPEDGQPGKLQLVAREIPSLLALDLGDDANDVIGEVHNVDYLGAVSVSGTLELSEFIYATGTFAFSADLIRQVDIYTGLSEDVAETFGWDDATIHDWPVATVTVGATNVSLFIGIGGPYKTDTNGDGVVDSAPNENATGIWVEGASLGIMIHQSLLPMDLFHPLTFQTFYSLKAEIPTAELVGLDDVLTASLKNVTVVLNDGPETGDGLGTAVVDFLSSYESSPGANDGSYEVPTGGDPVVLDYGPSQLIGASVEDFRLAIGSFVLASGSLSFEKGPLEQVDIATGIPANLRNLLQPLVTAALNATNEAGVPIPLTPTGDLSHFQDVEVQSMQFGMGGVDVFVGYGGEFNEDGSIDTSSAYGLNVATVDFGFALFKPTIYGFLDNSLLLGDVAEALNYVLPRGLDRPES